MPTREQILAADTWLRSIDTDESGADCKATLHDLLLAFSAPAPAADITAALAAWDRAFGQSEEKPREGDWKLVLDALERLNYLDRYSRTIYVKTYSATRYEMFLLESGKNVMTLVGGPESTPRGIPQDKTFWKAIGLWMRGRWTAKQVGDVFMDALQRVRVARRRASGA